MVSATPNQVQAFLNLFPKADYYFDLATALEACRQKSMFNILDTQTGWKIDVIFEKPSAYHQQAFQRRTAAAINGVPLYAATAEDTIVSKLEWAKMGESSRQIEDVAGILKVQGARLDRAYIEKWISALGLVSQWDRAREMAGLE